MNRMFPYCIITSLALLHAALGVDEAGSSGVTANPAAAGGGVQVGVARRDGITVTGGEAFITRNGATEKLTKDLVLPSGVVARPDGIIVGADHSETTLRSTQLLTFDGKVEEIPRDPRTNPGDPRSGATARGVAGGVAGNGGTNSPGGTAGAAVSGSSRSQLRERPNVSGSIFLGGDGVPFLGNTAPDGSIVAADGTVIPFNSAIRPVTFGPDGTPSLGALNSDGSITRADGSTMFPDGSLRGANGALLSPATASGAANSLAPQNFAPGAQTNNGVAAGRTTNNPNNTGTVNNGNTNPGVATPAPQGATTNRTTNGTTTRSHSSAPSSSGGRTTRGTNGASGGATTGGTSGAGGASGGGAGGASR